MLSVWLLYRHTDMHPYKNLENPVMERSDFRLFHWLISSDASILPTLKTKPSIYGSMHQRLASLDVGR